MGVNVAGIFASFGDANMKRKEKISTYLSRSCLEDLQMRH